MNINIDKISRLVQLSILNNEFNISKIITILNNIKLLSIVNTEFIDTTISINTLYSEYELVEDPLIVEDSLRNTPIVINNKFVVPTVINLNNN